MQEVCLSLINLEGADGKVEVKEKKQNQREVIIIDKEELYLIEGIKLVILVIFLTLSGLTAKCFEISNR